MDILGGHQILAYRPNLAYSMFLCGPQAQSSFCVFKGLLGGGGGGEEEEEDNGDYISDTNIQSLKYLLRGHLQKNICQLVCCSIHEAQSVLIQTQVGHCVKLIFGTPLYTHNGHICQTESRT